MLKTIQIFFSSMDMGSNESDLSWYQPFIHLKMINTQSQTHRPNDFILYSSAIFFSTWITPVAQGSLQIVKFFPTEQCRALDTVLLLEPPPCQAQWMISPGAQGKWWCIRGPWVPVPCLQQCHRVQNTGIGKSASAYDTLASPQLFPAGTLQTCINSKCLISFRSETVNKGGMQPRWSPTFLCPQTAACLSASVS